ncbi:MAG: hypothetical protein IAF08_10945 [Rhizobacter sp.]|nr:hypothetical protein [Chlorobiales bacterium]
MTEPVSLPFAHLNLTRNPFGEPAPGERSRLAVLEMDIEAVVAQLRASTFAIEFSGDAGRGKSTHLRGLHRYFPDAPFIYFADGAPLPEIPESPVLFLDELQRLPKPHRTRLFKRRVSFVVGTHAPFTAEYTSAKLEFIAIELRGLSPARLRKILEARMRWAQRDVSKPVSQFTEAALEHLIQKFGDDLRAIEHFLYEHFQTLTETGNVEV